MCAAAAQVYFFHSCLNSSYTLQDFLSEFWLWIWAVDILGSSHNASVVRAHDHIPAMCAAAAQVYFFRSCLRLSLLGECLSSVGSLCGSGLLEKSKKALFLGLLKLETAVVGQKHGTRTR